MPVADPPPIPQRSLPGIPQGFSLLGIAVEPEDEGSGGPETGVVQRLRSAREGGVTVFDAAAVRNPGRALSLLARAFPARDGRVTIIRPLPSSGPDPASVESGVLYDSGDELLPEAARGPNFVTRLKPGGDGLPPQTPALPRLYSGPLSLLDPRWAGPLTEAARSGALGFLVRDPFAGGLLDGSRFAGPWVGRGPSNAPTSLRSMEKEFGPVLRLRFLTETRSRTMAQAAIRFAAAPPWVLSVLVPLPPAERMAEILGAFRTPELTAEETRRVRAFSPSERDTAPSGRLLK